jgi:hypothetical protein
MNKEAVGKAAVGKAAGAAAEGVSPWAVEANLTLPAPAAAIQLAVDERESWACKTCTSKNEITADLCVVCSQPRISETTAAAAGPMGGQLPPDCVMLALERGPGGFGIEINPNGQALKYTGLGGVAEVAGVPVPSRIVRVNGISVNNKKEIVAVLSTAAGAVQFVFMQKGAHAPAPAAGQAPRQSSPWTILHAGALVEDDVDSDSDDETDHGGMLQQPADDSSEQRVPNREFRTESVLRRSLMRGQNGFGMQLLDDGTVSAYWGAGGSAEFAGVPLGSRIVSIDGTAVAGKQEVASALAGGASTAEKVFELLTSSTVAIRQVPTRSAGSCSHGR